MAQIKSWIVNHKLEFLILLAILLLGALLRLYKISGYMTFLGDEGRDVIIVRRLLIEGHPPLIGPGTSIGNMYLGPAYYYMMAIPLLLANFNPVGPAIFIALLGIVTIWFVWYAVRQFFPSQKTHVGALAAAFLYAISPVIIIYSRSSWNPNIMPFFSLLVIFSLWKFWINRNFNWLIVTAFAFACVLQSHYLGLLLTPVILIIWFLTYTKTNKKKKALIYSLLSLILFLALMSPLAIFDFRHNFINSKAIIAFFSDRQTTVSVLPWKAVPNMWPIFTNVTQDLVGAKDMNIGIAVAVIIVLALLFVYLLKKEKYNDKKVFVIFTLTSWLGFALLGLALYKQHIYDHYYGFIFTAPFIIIGGIIQFLISRKNKLLYVFIFLFIVILAFVDFQNSPLRSAPNMQLHRAQYVAKKVEAIANGQRFNFALIADSNYDSAYRYFLNLDKAPVVDINPQDTKSTVTDQLIVVCEREKAKCDPTHNPKTEIAAWGWSKVAVEYDNVDGVTIFKLAHTK